MINFLHTYIPDPIAFSIGAFSIHWYGLFMAAAILIGYFLVGKLAQYQGLQKQIITSLYVNVLIGGLIGARIYHVLNDWSFYASRLDQIPAVWNGGLAIHGAMIGGVLTALYFVKKHKINFWKVADLFVVPAILGQAIGRWGNYFNQELFGRPTDAAWGIPIQMSNRPQEYIQNEYFHPAFLYESILNLAIFAILLMVFKKQNRPDGLVFWLYLGLYSAVRILVESVRINQTAIVSGVRLPILVSIVLAVLSLGIILKTLSFKHKPQ